MDKKLRITGAGLTAGFPKSLVRNTKSLNTPVEQWDYKDEVPPALLPN